MTQKTPSSPFTIAPDGHSLIGEVWQADSAKGDVILLHGGGQTRHAWKGTGQALAGQGWNATTYDARGHGESDWRLDEVYNLDGHLADLTAILALGNSPPVLVGASMGGMTSLLMAGEHPGSVRGLVLVDIALRVDTVESDKVGAFMADYRDGFATLDEAAAAVQAYNPARTRPPSAEGLRRNLMKRADDRWYWRWDPAVLNSRADMGSWSERLKAAACHIKVPVMLVRGMDSLMIDQEIRDEFMDHIPHASVVDVTGAGHMVAGDDNSAFMDAVKLFLQNQT